MGLCLSGRTKGLGLRKLFRRSSKPVVPVEGASNVNAGAGQTPMSEENRPEGVKVFVLLGHDFGANSWEQKYARGIIPGLNDRLAYGYYRAAGDGWSVEYSQDRDEGRLTRLGRLGLRKLLGFDLIHVCRNRRGIFAADVVWTHTEIEHLGVLALFRLLRQRRRRPKLVANCVWLFDRWSRLSRAKRFLYRVLLQEASVVTTLSPENLKAARRLLPAVRCECVLWGIPNQEMKAPRRVVPGRPLRIASLGNDMHRDWPTFLAAFANLDRYEVRIGSSRIERKLLKGVRNVTAISAMTADEVRALYEWADLVVVALKPNLHASGITVVFESVIRGVPSICTDTGGLRAYFSDSEVAYVPDSAPMAMRAAADKLCADHEQRFNMAVSAQRRLISGELTAHGFALRNRRLSEELLASSYAAASCARISDAACE
jgi:glycosyltransferase involved in cell wall biosynthesis